MQLTSAPVKIVLPFAADGGKNIIPVASQIGITNGAASFTDGFPPLTRTPVASGGIPPFGLDMNGVLFDATALSLWYNAGASFPYDSDFATNINVGGYPQGAQVLRSDGLGFWLNTTDNNETNPESSPANWVPGFTTGVAAIAMTNANVTLTPVQYGKPIIVITGLLTGNLNLIFPNIANEWSIINNTTGAFTITGKTASGAGVTLPQGTPSIIVCDGSNNIYTLTPISAGVVGSISNGSMSVPANSASATFTADEILVEPILGGGPTKLSSYSKTVNLATTGAGGMDTGTAPVSGYVAVYAISGSAGVSILATNATSAAAPSIYGGSHMPSGYISSALLSVWPTDGSSQFVSGYQTGKQIYIQSVQVLNTSTIQTSLTSLNIAAAVPKNAKSWSGYIDMVTSGTLQSLNFEVAGSSTGIGSQLITCTNPSGGTGVSSIFYGIPIIAAQVLYYLVNTTGGTLSAQLNISSYII